MLTKAAGWAVLAALAGAPALARNGDEFAAGREEYLNFCSACHGEMADGNGPIATMFTIPVPDLRKISARNDGKFPLTEVFQIIDGRSVVKAHGDPMPMFGARYRREMAGEGETDAAAERLARQRLLELTIYLQSIQE